MTDDQPAASGQPGFVRGNERLDQLLVGPQLAADVAAAHADAEEMDRVNAMMLNELDRRGARVETVAYSPHRPEQDCPYRKPRAAYTRRSTGWRPGPSSGSGAGTARRTMVSTP